MPRGMKDLYTLLFFLPNAVTFIIHVKVRTCSESSRLLASVVSRGRELIQRSAKKKSVSLENFGYIAFLYGLCTVK